MAAEDQIPTVLFDDVRILPPVENVQDLPVIEAREGHICFVIRENLYYEYENGVWITRLRKREDD